MRNVQKRNIFVALDVSGVTRVKNFWLSYKRNKMGVVGLIILVLLIFISFFAPILSPYDYMHSIDTSRRGKPPCINFPMGTDHLGRDVLSGVIEGTRTSLMIGLIVSLLSTIIGIIVGVFAGYYGGRIDHLISRFIEILLCIPSFFLIVVFISFFGGSLMNTVIVIASLSWPTTSRLVRAQFMTIKELSYIEAAKVGGAGDTRIIFRHILPNAIPPAVINMSFLAASAILIEASLSYIGLGDPNLVSWGMMLHYAASYIRTQWWQAFFPGLAIFVTVLAFNLVGDGLNDALNPRLRGR